MITGDECITYEAFPHIGSDVLIEVIRRMREEILALGGEIHFRHTLKDIEIENGQINKILINDQWIECDNLIIGIGHSARDTFRMLNKNKVYCTPKNFAVGVRIEHSQDFVDYSQYGKYARILPHASYRLTHTTTKNS